MFSRTNTCQLFGLIRLTVASALALAFSASLNSSASLAGGLNLKEVVVALKADKNPDQMVKERASLENELSNSLKVPVKVLIPTSSAVILQGFANGTIDAGYLSSLDMVNAERVGAAELLLAGRIKEKTSYESLWLVKKASTYQKIEDLKGKSISFASRTSTSGYLIPYWDLINKKLLSAKQDPSTFFGDGNVWYGTGYVSAIQRVLDSTAEAAAVSDYVYFGDKHLTSEQKNQLRVLQKQGPVPTHVIAVRKSLSDTHKKAIREALIKLNSNPKLRDQVFTSELVEVDSKQHLASTREALELTGLIFETK